MKLRGGEAPEDPGSRVRLGAAASRIAVAVLMMASAPLAAPGLSYGAILFGTYLASSLVAMLLIWRGVGPRLRVALFGLVDILLITYLVHQLGSGSTPLVSLYVFFGLAHALVTSARTALALATAAAAAYAGLVLAEISGHLPYGPDLVIPALHPGPGQAIASAILVIGLTVGATALVSGLVRAIRRHERELVEANALLAELSRRDPLTRVFNRRYVLERLDVELVRARRGHPLAVLMVDLDGFKQVNDLHGHAAGDALLQRIGAALIEVTRDADVPGRLGGDEFVLVLPDTDAEHATAVARRLVERIRQIGAEAEGVTASVGLAVPEPDESPAELLRRGDEALYRAKADGGDRLTPAS